MPTRNQTKRMNADCHYFKAASKEIKSWILSQSTVKEESLTDWLLYDISRNIGGVVYFPFSRHVEGKTTGADWEWWFLFPRFAIRMRVQAKRIHPQVDNYEGLAYKKKTCSQVDKLLSDSAKTNSLPFYAFFSAESHHNKCRKGVVDEGVFLAAASQVYSEFVNGRAHRATSEALQEISLPLSCFTCCPLRSIQDSSRGMKRFLDHYFPIESGEVALEDSASAVPSGNGIHEELPDYVGQILEQSQAANKEKSLIDLPEDVGAVVIADWRE